MIGPLVPMAVPPAQPNRTPAHDASMSFLDWVLGKGVPSPPAALAPQVVAGASVQPGGVTVPPVPPDSAMLAATPAPEMSGLALHIEHRAGAVELIVLPWRLVATGSLAHVLGLQAQAGAGGSSATAELQASSVPPARSSMAMGPSQAGAGAGCDSETGTTLAPLASGPFIAMERFDQAEYADVHARADAPAALPWVARLLRWLDGHGEATLWVRDFRLDEGDKRALVATLRATAAQSGFRLDRIVINGRAHWHLHRPTRGTSHAG